MRFIGRLAFYLSAFVLFSVNSFAQQNDVDKFPVNYEELTSPDFIKAIEKSNGTCIIPFGILEKHGPHLPLGTDLLDAREISIRAAKNEYVIVFPQYYFGQIFEAKHQPGTIAYSSEIIWRLLQETCDELSRNGIKKIILVNGHGGNNNFLKYFCQAQLEKRKDYVVIMYTPVEDPEVQKEIIKLRKTVNDDHAGETETSSILAFRPDLVQLDKASTQSGEDKNQLDGMKDAFTGIWWYAKFPNHYAGDGSPANKTLGDLILNSDVDQLTKFIRSIKKDNRLIDLQNKFFDEADKPLKTKVK